jgi:hypothetical protein
VRVVGVLLILTAPVLGTVCGSISRPQLATVDKTEPIRPVNPTRDSAYSSRIFNFGAYRRFVTLAQNYAFLCVLKSLFCHYSCVFSMF